MNNSSSLQNKELSTNSATEPIQSNEKQAKLDGKFAWLMVFIGLMVHFVVYGTVGSFGVYLAEYIKEDFSEQPKSLMSLVGSLGTAIYSLFAVPAGILVAKVGHRISILSGAIIFGAGLVIASFATQPWTLFIGQALFLGVAVSISFIPTISIVPQWLDKHRGLGVGICAAGSGVGGLVLAPVIQAMIDSIGWRWALRINGIIIAIILAAASLILKPRVAFNPPKNFIDIEILKNPKFIAMWAQAAASCFAYWIPFFIMPLYCQYYNISASTASLIVGLTNGAAAIGRIATGKISDRFGNINTLLLSNFICSLTFILIWNFATVTWSLIVFGLIFGFFSGAHFTISALLAPQLFGFEKLPQVNGLFYTSSTPGYLAGTVIATSIVNSYTVDNVTNFLPCMFFLFGCYLISCVCLILLRVQVTRDILVKV